MIWIAGPGKKSNQSYAKIQNWISEQRNEWLKMQKSIV